MPGLGQDSGWARLQSGLGLGPGHVTTLDARAPTTYCRVMVGIGVMEVDPTADLDIPHHLTPAHSNLEYTLYSNPSHPAPHNYTSPV